MRPTLAAQALRDTAVEYLTTTFALAEPDTQDALTGFLTDPADGLFRGPYLRIRRPFRSADDGWQQHLDWWKPDFWPYAHQAEAFARLTTKAGHSPLPTLVTTGTGSGKTESFLVPVLDHCRRAKAEGKPGIKAVLLYPMNALAGDQADRIGELLEDDRLAEVTAGLYIGEANASRAASPYKRVMVDRQEIRRNPPDILITNYKMLDLLLQRQHDTPLWQDADLAYIVIDEFHTYDGAQGTDVAMLLRRLSAAVGAAEEGRPLGRICPVATSATLGENSTATVTAVDAASTSGRLPMLDVASQVFGVCFPDDSVVVEDRRELNVFLSPLDLTLPLPTPAELAALPDPARTPGAIDAIARAVAGCDTVDARELGRRLLAHPLLHALLQADVDSPLTTAEALGAFDPTSPWRAAIARDPAVGAVALARLVALVSVAREPSAPAGRERPLLLVESHLWMRSLSRVLRYVTPTPVFSWSDADQAADRDALADMSPALPRGGPARGGTLPAIYCRHCGRSGWTAISPDRNPAALISAPDEIYRRSVAGGPIKGRVRALVSATPAEAAEQARAILQQRTRRGRRAASHNATVLVLEESGEQLRRLEPDEVFRGDGTVAPAPENGVYVLAWYDNSEADDYSRGERCPACGQAEGIRFLGAGVAPLASVVVTQLFTGGELPSRDAKGEDRRRTLIFNDSVQDAAHRAGFVASRAWKFSLRSLIHEQVQDQVQQQVQRGGQATGEDYSRDGVPLNELISSLVARAAVPDAKLLASVVPPDLHDVDRVARLLDNKKRVPASAWTLVGERLALNTILEFGLYSRMGRTLELTRTLASEVHLKDPARTVTTAEALFDEYLRRRQNPDTPQPLDGLEEVAPAAKHPLPTVPSERRRRFEGFVRGLLEHLRQSGGIQHAWLSRYIDEEGRNRYPLTTQRPEGMPGFGRGSDAPAFLLVGSRSGKTDFERADSKDSWYADFTHRCLGLDHKEAADYLAELVPLLADEGIEALAHRRTGEAVAGAPRHGRGTYGLTAGHIRIFPLDDQQTAQAAVTCPECGWTQTVPPERVPVWQGLPCPLKRCEGALTVPSSAADGRAARDFRSDYYRRLYRDSGPYSVVAAEHTGVLTRKEREAVEKGFRTGTGRHTDPNVLSCTPTLELGIDIGQLEAVILASLPQTTASYVQRVGRAGRSTGNALMVSIADTSPHALYHLADPRQLIAGRILPPGCFLSAAELLRRQYTAHLVDLTARGRIEGVIPLPDRVTALFGRTGWLRTFGRAVAGRMDLVEEFLCLFPDIPGVRDSGVTREARKKLRRYAEKGLLDALVAAEDAWEAERTELLDRRAMINEAADALQDTVEDEAREKRNLEREARGVSSRLGAMGKSSAQGFLVEQGLLPNYTLVEGGVRLEASLTHKEPPLRQRNLPAEAEDGKAAATARWRTELRPYDRPAEAALSELAPGNTYYVRGYRHKIDGFDLGPRSDRSENGIPRAVRYWRICQDCGHVRTENAEQDTSACPRCGGAGIGGRSALRTVIVPRKVTSRDKRDDARIIDDHDSRSSHNYTIATAVDIDPAAVRKETSWRHKQVTFGVDHVRVAVIRRFNLGRAKFGRRADTAFAGQQVNVTGFTVCTMCGGATDREPGNAPVQEAISESLSLASRPDLAHHRPWCPTRSRSHPQQPEEQRVITATEHTTEALRILLPAATYQVAERLASFSAALHLGIAKRYGGDPAHIRSTTSSEPDRETELTRHYLVLYDALAGGTGYLERLAGSDGEEFRSVLAAAQQVLRQCSCATGPHPRKACHLCLLGHAPQRDYRLLDRQEALWMLDELLGVDGRSGWQPIRTEHTGSARMRFANQAESDLERRFIDTFDRWLAKSGQQQPHGHAETPTGRIGKQFTLERSDAAGPPLQWELIAQKHLPEHATRPDLLLRPLADSSAVANSAADSTVPSIAIYLDGYRWHASSKTNRIAGDAAKRARLRADGTLVWQITWDDVMAWEEGLRERAKRSDEDDVDAPPNPLAAVIAGAAADAAWPPYDISPAGPGGKVREQWRNARRDPAELDELVYAGAIPSLLGFLRKPDQAYWQDLAVRAVSGLLANPAQLAGNVAAADPSAATPWIEAALRDEPRPAVTGQGLRLIAAKDGSGLPLLVIVDQTQAAAKLLRWSCLTVLDDRDQALDGDRPEHRRRWKAWLCWGNLLQFLDPAGSGRADGLQLARSGLDGFDAGLLAAVSSPEALRGRAAGILPALREELSGTGLLLPDPTPEVVAEPVLDNRPTPLEQGLWELCIKELSYVGDPGIITLARSLAERQDAPAPKDGVGLDVSGIDRPIELAWPDQRIGVVLAEDAADHSYMRQCREAGWQVRAPDAWSIEELIELLTATGGAR